MNNDVKIIYPGNESKEGSFLFLFFFTSTEARRKYIKPVMALTTTPIHALSARNQNKTFKLVDTVLTCPDDVILISLSFFR